MDKDFKACTVCTSTCFKEHGVGAAQQTAPIYTRPPCFLLTSLEVSTNWTPIPREFVESHGETLRGPARILGSNGREWSVEIGGPGKLLGFKGGWKSFVSSTSVKRGDQMLFSLVSKGCFTVHVFNKLGVEVVPSPPEDTKPAPTPASGKRKRLEIKAEPVSEEEESSDDGDSSDSDMSEYEASKNDDPSASDTEVKPTVEDEEILSKPRKRVKRKLSGSVTTQKSSQKTSDKKKVRANTNKEGIYIEPGSCTTTYESRRREVTRAELDRTLERARALKTKFPSVSVVMMPSHVYRGFWLTIPGKFSKEFMPQEKKEVALRDKHGYDWVATWIRSDKHTGLSGGWAAFSKDHCLEEGDVCVFEVVDSKEWIISVHIFRVVEVRLKPGHHGEWEKTYNIVHGAQMYRSGAVKKMKSRRSTPVKRSGSSISSVKKSITSKSSRKMVSEESDTDESDEEDSDCDEEDNLPLTNLCKEKGSSDVTSEEVDVKPKIISLGPIPKITKVKEEPVRLVKVKEEPGLLMKVKQETDALPAMIGVTKENGIHSRDVKPSAEELRASLSQFSSVTTASVVKPEPMDTDGRKWHPIVRLLGKRQNDFLVDLGPSVICTSTSCSPSEDGSGKWWVPRSQLSADMGRCFLE